MSKELLSMIKPLKKVVNEDFMCLLMMSVQQNHARIVTITMV